jgi:hypothetical protein
MRFLISIIFAFIAVTDVAHAACRDAVSDKEQSLAFSILDQDTREGLSESLSLGLNPVTFPQEDISKASHPCLRTRFRAGAAEFSLYGMIGEAPPRWATSANQPGRIVYVAELPFPKRAVVEVAAQQGQPIIHFKPADFMFVLAVTDGARRDVFRFYDKMPNDERLSEDMCAALTGEDPVVASYDELSNQTVFLGNASSQIPATGHCHGKVS